MSLNLLKLCVGAESVEDLEAWIAERRSEARARGLPAEQFHTTRMVPTRAAELTAGGSLYWVIKGNVQCRQRLTEIRPFVDADGISRCRLVLDPVVVRTRWQPRRAFQGWRYLPQADAPIDLDAGSGGWQALPAELRVELANLGLL